MSTNDIAVFSFQSKNVRTLTIDGETIFRASDVASVLGMRTSALLQRVPADEVISSDLIDAMGRAQETRFLSEAGMYRAVLRSDKKEAEPFMRWVTREVLPSIRKNGFYLTEKLKKDLEERDAELERKEKVILQLQATTKKKRKTPRLRVPNYNVFEGHEPVWELAAIEDVSDPQKTLGLLRKTIAQIDGLRDLAMKFKRALGIAEKD